MCHEQTLGTNSGLVLEPTVAQPEDVIEPIFDPHQGRMVSLSYEYQLASGCSAIAADPKGGMLDAVCSIVC
jgi:hypothetical protein